MSFNRKKARKRNRDELEHLLKCRDDSDDENADGKTIFFQNGDISLTLDRESNFYTYGKTDYDEQLIGSDYYWHQIIIPHQKKFNAKKEVLPEMFKIVEDELFAPIAYRSSRESDYFFVHSQGAALRKLFDNDLRVFIDDDRQVNLVVKFCVSKFMNGMLSLPRKLSKIISSSVSINHSTLLDLSFISGHQELTDVKFTMSNQGSFELVVENLCKAQHTLQNVKTLSLSNNEIVSLKPLSKLVGLNLRTLNLKYNKLTSLDEFNHLKHLNLYEIILLGNPITDVPLFKEKIKAILPSLGKVDSADVETSTAVDNRTEPIKFFNKNTTIKIEPSDVNDYFKKSFFKYDNNLWNKVVVNHKGKVEKNIILVHINRQLFKRTLFVPCYYESGPKQDIFFLHDNFEALNALVQKNLVMTIPTIRTEIKFELYLKCADWIEGHVNWRYKINYALKKRMKGMNLNLDNFSSDSNLNQNLMVNMSSIAMQSYVLNVALELNKNITTMSIKENKITTVEGFQNLKDFRHLEILDLCDNYIESFETFPVLPSVVKVSVDGNPFCVKFYSAPWRYIDEMMKIFPNLQYIDGRRIEKSFIPIVPLQNFFVSRSAYGLTETFVKCFFEIYDSQSRNALANFYGEKSMFSMSTKFAQKPENVFEANSRNLLTNMKSRILIGNNNIVEFFDSLPESLHDVSTMCIDVMVMNELNVVININGFFKVQSVNLDDDEVLFAFTRTFNLERLNPVDGTFCNTFRFVIKNELLQVRQIEADESVEAFKKTVISENELERMNWGLMPTMSQANQASILILKELTKLKTSYCKRLLEDADWDIEVAIQHFLALIERNFFSENDFNNLRNVSTT